VCSNNSEVWLPVDRQKCLGVSEEREKSSDRQLPFCDAGQFLRSNTTDYQSKIKTGDCASPNVSRSRPHRVAFALAFVNFCRLGARPRSGSPPLVAYAICSALIYLELGFVQAFASVPAVAGQTSSRLNGWPGVINEEARKLCRSATMKSSP
jgi:hypothetical protein